MRRHPLRAGPLLLTGPLRCSSSSPPPRLLTRFGTRRAQAGCSAVALFSPPSSPYRAALLPLGLLCCAPQLRSQCGAALPVLLYSVGGALLLANLSAAAGAPNAGRSDGPPD